jgi:hypothetical protein
MVSPIIKVDPASRTATANWYLWEPMKTRHPDGEIADTWFGATYDAHLRKTDGVGWQIFKLTLDAKLLAKVGEAWPGDIQAKQV